MLTVNHLRLGSVVLASVLAASLAWPALRSAAPPSTAQLASVAPSPAANALSPPVPPKPSPARTSASRPTKPAQIAAVTRVPAPSPSPAEAARDSQRVEIEAKLAGAPEYAAFAEKYRNQWPADWGAFLDRIARQRAAGETNDNPDAWMADALHQLRHNRGVIASRASPAALLRVLASQSSILSALSVMDNRMCVDFLFGQQNDAFLDFSNRHRPLIAQMAGAAADAIIEGGSGRAARTPPDDADFDTLETALRENGLDKLEIEAMLDAKLPDPPLSDERLCKAGNIYLETLKTLPEGPRLRLNALAVELMSKL